MGYDRLGTPTVGTIITRYEYGEPSEKIAADIRRNDDATRRMIARVTEAASAFKLAEAVKIDRTWRNVPCKELMSEYYGNTRLMSESRFLELCTARVEINPKGNTPMASWGGWDYKITPPYSAFEKAAMKHRSWESIPWDKVLQLPDDVSIGYIIKACDNHAKDEHDYNTRWFRNPGNYTQVDIDRVAVSNEGPSPYGVSSWMMHAIALDDAAYVQDDLVKASMFNPYVSADVFINDPTETRRLNDLEPDNVNPIRNPAISTRMDRKPLESDEQLGLKHQGNKNMADVARYSTAMEKERDNRYMTWFRAKGRERPLTIEASKEKGTPSGFIGLNYAQNRDDFLQCRESSLEYGKGIQ